MISYLNGVIVAQTEKYIILDVNGVGYRVYISGNKNLNITENGQKVNVFTKLIFNMRDGSYELYGFADSGELEMFELLQTVSGIGPKSAHSIVCSSNVKKLGGAIFRGDENYLKEFAGVGPKAAKKIIMELKDKISADSLDVSEGFLSLDNDVLTALISLGYAKRDAIAVLEKLDTKLSLEEKVREGLKLLGK